MKKIIGMAALCLMASVVHAQNDPVDTTQIVVKTDATHSTPALIHLPNDYNTSSHSYPLLIFCHGMGEDGGPARVLYNNSSAGGPAYSIAHGLWPSSFTNPVDGQSYKFIVVSPWNTPGAGGVGNTSITAVMLNAIIADLISHYRVDASRIYLTGLSAGGEAAVTYIGNNRNDNGAPIPSLYKIAAAVPMSAVFNASHMQALADSTFAHRTGLWSIGSPSDAHGANTLGLNYYINLDSAGYGQSTSYSGGHCCWGQFYDPTYTQAWRGHNISIYQFMLEYQSVQGTPPAPLVANAGVDQSIQLPLDSVSLSGNGSTGGVTSYAWSSISGPAAPVIVTPSAITTKVTGLSTVGDYAFRLTVQNAGGTTARDTVVVHVAAAPSSSYDPVDTTQITVQTGTTYTTPALIHLPSDYNAGSGRYPLIIFCNGASENGGPAYKLYNNNNSGGPSYFIAHGQWPSSFTNPVDGQSYKFIVVSPWYTSGANATPTNYITASNLNFIITDLISRLRIDTSRIYLTGVTTGGEGVVTYMSNIRDDVGGPVPTRYKIAAAVPMSAAFNAFYMKAMADSTFARKTGLWCIGDGTESLGANTLGLNYYINLDSAGYGQSSTFTGGQCCWGQFYDPTYSKVWRGQNVSIYQFMLEYKVQFPGGGGGGGSLPGGVALTNYPNPFKGTTTVRFTLDKPANVVLKVNSQAGSTLAVLVNGRLAAGVHQYDKAFDWGRLSAGVYILQLNVDGQQHTRLMVKE